MTDCTTCEGGRRERLYRRVPRQERYFEKQYSPRPVRHTEIQYNPRPRKFSWSQMDCDNCYVARDGNCVSCRTSVDPCPPACPPPCPIERCYYCPQETESGFLHTIRNGFQRIFNGRKRGCSTGCEPMNKGKTFNYTPGQIRYIEQHLEKLEDEACCIENIIKEAYNCECTINCNSVRNSLSTISERVDGIRCDLLCAYDCYDPCRDRCEYELICSLLDRVNRLECMINDLCLQLECLAYESDRYPPTCEVDYYQMSSQKRCKPNCEKPCCLRPVACKVPCQPYCKPAAVDCRKRCCAEPDVCEVGCRKPCCYKLVQTAGKCRRACCIKPVACEPGCRKPCCVKPNHNRGGNGKRRLCRTSSVIPVGVMLVKL